MGRDGSYDLHILDTLAYLVMEMSAKFLVSKAATLQHVKSNVDIPIPEVYDYR